MAKSIVTDLIQIYKASVAAVLPNNLIKSCMKYNPNYDILMINEDKFDIQNKRVFVVGAGKAVQYMAQEVDKILGHKIEKGIISIPLNSLDPNLKTSNLKYCEGAKNNLPDEHSKSTAEQIKELAASLSAEDLLLVLISGGGSALLPLPKPPITLTEKTELIKKLANSGADIIELNTVRKRISDTKGGKLAIYANPASVVSLILSDIVGDPLELIASGPTIEDKDDPEKALEVIKKFNLYDDLPKSIKKTLEEKPKPEIFPSTITKNYIVGSNRMSISAAYEESEKLNYLPIILSRSVIGNVKNIAKEYAKLAKTFCQYAKGKYDVTDLKHHLECLEIAGIETNGLEKLINSGGKNYCLILGGEPTVEVKGTGLGGRNQQLALEFSYAVNEIRDDFDDFNVFFLSAGTDGIDGPTNAAGAIGYLDLITDCKNQNIDASYYLLNNDSYNFYKKFEMGKYHVVIGHTNTNVMDIHLIIIQHK